MKTTIIISNESQEVTSEAIYMLLNARKLLFILTPLLTLLITIGTIYLIHHLNLHHQNQNQNQNRNQHLHRTQYQQQRRVVSRQGSTSSSNSLQRHNEQQPAGEQPQSSNNLHSSTLANHSNDSSFSEKLVNIGENSSSREQQSGRHSRHQPEAMKPTRDGQTGLLENRSNNNGVSESNITSENISVSKNSIIKVSNHTTKEEKSSQEINLTAKKQQVTNLKLPEQQPRPQNSSDDTLKRTNFDIVLDRGNFVLASRCSNDRIYIKINKRTKMPIISTSPQNLFKNTNSRQKDAAKIKILSTVLTIESVPRPDLSKATTKHLNGTKNLDVNNNNDSLNYLEIASKRITNSQLAAASAIKTVKADLREGEEGERIELSKEKAGDHQVEFDSKKLLSTREEYKAGAQRAEPLLSSREIGFVLNRSPVVKLRANLTQLYICFSLQGKLEGRVNGDDSSCLFNELTVDHRYVKYQSFYNSSWFVGFDKTGSPIPGQYVIKRDGSNMAMKQERCYHFMKLNRLSTTAQVFPEVMPLIQEATNRSSSVSSLATFLREAAAIKANLRQPHASVPSFNQKQLINMTRYRNILRYQFGRPMGQPLVAIPSAQAQHNTNSNNLKIVGSFSSNNKRSDNPDTDVVNSSKSSRNQSKTTAKRKTSSAESEQQNRRKPKRTPTEPMFEDLDDTDGDKHNNQEMYLDLIHQSKLISIENRENERWDFAMENFSKFSAPASAA